jgi:hypothetical protein
VLVRLTVGGCTHVADRLANTRVALVRNGHDIGSNSSKQFLTTAWERLSALDRRSPWKGHGNDRMQSGEKPQAAEPTENGLI